MECEGLVPDNTEFKFLNLGTLKVQQSLDQKWRGLEAYIRNLCQWERDWFTSLKEKHGSKYSAAQLWLWANMLQTGTHRDYDEPPKVPMFGVNAKTGTKSPCLADTLSNVGEGFMHAQKSPRPAPSCSSLPTRIPSQGPLQDMGVSPGKCAPLRTQYIQQFGTSSAAGSYCY